MVGFEQDIKILHLEPTTICNAKCSQCARENPDLYVDSLNRNDITLKKCIELFGTTFIKNLDKMFMCGDFGDPAAGKHTLEIFEYFRKVNPQITLGMNTNGSIGNKQWWIKLAKILNTPNDFVVFSIDGLKDTNHIYRRGVNWDKLINNATTFIEHGGSAHWDMLIFEHNEHQLSEAEELANTLGFNFFRSKVSKRFLTNPIKGLEPPKTFKLPNTTDISKVKCHALEDNSIYVSADGKILPCCWIGVYTYNSDDYLTELLNSNNWNKLVTSWNNNPHSICLDTCGVNNCQKTSFQSQWNKEIKLR